MYFPFCVISLQSVSNLLIHGNCFTVPPRPRAHSSPAGSPVRLRRSRSHSLTHTFCVIRLETTRPTYSETMVHQVVDPCACGGPWPRGPRGTRPPATPASIVATDELKNVRPSRRFSAVFACTVLGRDPGVVLGPILAYRRVYLLGGVVVRFSFYTGISSGSAREWPDHGPDL